MGLGLVRAAAVAVAAAGLFVTAWMLWPRPATVAAPQARQYLDASACLLTGAGGVTAGSPGAQAWRVMESASLASHVMVSYLPAAEPADAAAMLNTLVERRCGVIVVTGASRAQVATAAEAYPGHQFILVVSSAVAGPVAMPANATVVAAGDASERIDQEVTALAGPDRAGAA